MSPRATASGARAPGRTCPGANAGAAAGDEAEAVLVELQREARHGLHGLVGEGELEEG